MMKSEESIKDELLYTIKDIRKDFDNWTWEQRNFHVGYACALAETLGRYSLCDLLNDKVEEKKEAQNYEGYTLKDLYDENQILLETIANLQTQIEDIRGKE